MKQKEKMMGLVRYVEDKFPEGCGEMPCLGCPLQMVEEDTIEYCVCNMLLWIKQFTEKLASEIEVTIDIVNEYNKEEDKYEVIT